MSICARHVRRSDAIHRKGAAHGRSCESHRSRFVLPRHREGLRPAGRTLAGVARRGRGSQAHGAGRAAQERARAGPRPCQCAGCLAPWPEWRGMKLLYSRNPNPRLAVAVARQVRAPVEFEFAAPLAPGQAERYRPLNPCLRLPIVVLPGGGSLWEADAIACRLSRAAGSTFWRTDDTEPAMIQWISWGKENFVRACDMVQFEYVTKQRY